MTFSRPWFKDHNFQSRGSRAELARLTATARFALEEPALVGSASSDTNDTQSEYRRAAIQLRSEGLTQREETEGDCVDHGPWVCLEPGCPAPLVDCAMLRTACSTTFAEVWRAPPPELGNQNRMPIFKQCPLTCRMCERANAPTCPRDDAVCAPELCWAVLKRRTLVDNGNELADLRRSKWAPTSQQVARLRHWLVDTATPPRGTYADGVDLAMVVAPDKAANVSQNHTQGTADTCLVDRCAVLFGVCAGSEECRWAWSRLMERLKGIREVVQLRTDRIEHDSLRALIDCFFHQCLCVAGLVSESLPHVARFPNALDEDDVSAILTLAAQIGQNASFFHRRAFGESDQESKAGHNVTYLHSRFSADPLTSSVYERIRQLVIQADVQSGWRRVHPPTLVPRTIELLNYSRVLKDTRFSLGWHVDDQSALTALLLLSDPSQFEGGELYHIVRGQQVSAQPHQYEILVYRSHQPHAVGALRSGQRLAVAIEFWHVHAPGNGVDDPEYAHTRVDFRPDASQETSRDDLIKCPL